jgi:hypothetical protein
MPLGPRPATRRAVTSSHLKSSSLQAAPPPDHPWGLPPTSMHRPQVIASSGPTGTISATRGSRSGPDACAQAISTECGNVCLNRSARFTAGRFPLAGRLVRVEFVVETDDPGGWGLASPSGPDRAHLPCRIPGRRGLQVFEFPRLRDRHPTLRAILDEEVSVGPNCCTPSSPSLYATTTSM